MTTLTAPPSSAPARAAADRRDNLRARRRRRLGWIADHAVGIALAIVFLSPFVFIVLQSLMTSAQALTGDLWPRSWHPENYVEVFTRAPMLTYLRNTLLYAGLATLLMLVSSIPAAYALSRLQWRGRTAALVVVLMMMMLPPQVTQVPIYVMWTNLHLTGTLWPLILPNLLGDAFSIFLLRQFFLTIPQEYADAARVDGCSEWRVMTRVVLPMAKSGIAATAMFLFFYCWNDFYGPLLYTSENPDNWTISLGLASFRNLYQVQWNLTMAATILAMIPVLVVFFLAQKVFVEGITLTGVKG
ncbi:MAG TPA: carbohydrate ABC transporter permease [Candidatus Nanopelagicales bacterium]|nr:carbohydrate ABC transporter permease [Candidatus Nanopelagicales bacterium]